MPQQIPSYQFEVYLQLETVGSCGIPLQLSLPWISFLWNGSGRYNPLMKKQAETW